MSREQLEEYRFSILKSGNFPMETGDFPLGIMVHHNEPAHMLHTHDYVELIIVEGGSGMHLTETFEHLLVPGDVFVIPQGMKHGYRDCTNLTTTNILFTMPLLQGFREDLLLIPGFHTLFVLDPQQSQQTIDRKGFMSIAPDEAAHVQSLIVRMQHELRSKCVGYRSVCILVLAEVIIFLSRKASVGNPDVHTERLAVVLSYMENNYCHNLTLDQLGRIANLSPRTFQRVFRRHMDTSPFDHLLNIRLRHARILLENTDLSVGEVASKTGFGDGAYFARQFKRMFRISPSVFRHTIRQP